MWKASAESATIPGHPTAAGAEQGLEEASAAGESATIPGDPGHPGTELIIDAVVLWEGELGAVEVDGPSHFLGGDSGQ